MSYIFTALLLMLSLCVGAQTTDRVRKYENPVISRSWADPTVWRDGDDFYTVSTGVGTILTSKDMVNWTDMKISPLSAEAKSAGRKVGSHFWAPDVIKIGNRWMLYLTCYNAAEDCGIAAFESASPTGPWEYVSLITHSKTNGIKDTIDPEVVRDPASGKVWMFFGSVGKIHRVELNREGTALASGARFVHVAGLDIDDSPSREKVYEGAYLYRHGKFWYLFASRGKYYDSSYKIVVGRSPSLKGTFVDKDGRKMKEGNASVILESGPGDDFFGPGHNGEIFSDAKGNLFMLYHCHQMSRGGKRPRYTLLQKILWDEDGWPCFETGKPLLSAPSPVF